MCFDGEEKKLNLFLPQVLIQRETARTQDRNCTETEEEKKLNLFLPQVLYTKKMSSYQEQLAKCKSSTEKYNTIWKNKEWTIKDYEDLFTDIERGYIIQGDFDTHHNYFIINPAFEE